MSIDPPAPPADEPPVFTPRQVFEEITRESGQATFRDDLRIGATSFIVLSGRDQWRDDTISVLSTLIANVPPVGTQGECVWGDESMGRDVWFASVLTSATGVVFGRKNISSKLQHVYDKVADPALQAIIKGSDKTPTSTVDVLSFEGLKTLLDREGIAGSQVAWQSSLAVAQQQIARKAKAAKAAKKTSKKTSKKRSKKTSTAVEPKIEQANGGVAGEPMERVPSADSASTGVSLVTPTTSDDGSHSIVLKFRLPASKTSACKPFSSETTSPASPASTSTSTSTGPSFPSAITIDNVSDSASPMMCADHFDTLLEAASIMEGAKVLEGLKPLGKRKDKVVRFDLSHETKKRQRRE